MEQKKMNDEKKTEPNNKKLIESETAYLENLSTMLRREM